MVGKTIREILKKQGLTFRKVARDMAIDHASLHRSLKNGGNPEWNTIEKILNYLGYDFKIIKRKGVKPEKSKPPQSRRKERDSHGSIQKKK
jgi:transcriptional regulator with XRE-family HTH domain